MFTIRSARNLWTMTLKIKQSIAIKSSPKTIYAALISSNIFGRVTEAPAEIDAREGGIFSCFGGQITGRFIELLENKRIVQAWRVGIWDEGVFSVVRFELTKSGNSTIINLEHNGFPDEMAEHLETGWHKMYWEPLKKYLE